MSSPSFYLFIHNSVELLFICSAVTKVGIRSSKNSASTVAKKTPTPQVSQRPELTLKWPRLTKGAQTPPILLLCSCRSAAMWEGRVVTGPLSTALLFQQLRPWVSKIHYRESNVQQDLAVVFPLPSSTNYPCNWRMFYQCHHIFCCTPAGSRISPWKPGH